jgi:hypothetical protein
MTDKSLVDEAGLNSLDPKHAPITLPAGSYDFDTLVKAGEKVVDADPDKRDESVRAALIEAAPAGASIDAHDSAAQEGFETHAVEHPTIDGLVEQRSVFVDVEKPAKKSAAKKGGDQPADATATGNQ